MKKANTTFTNHEFYKAMRDAFNTKSCIMISDDELFENNKIDSCFRFHEDVDDSYIHVISNNNSHNLFYIDMSNTVLTIKINNQCADYIFKEYSDCVQSVSYEDEKKHFNRCYKIAVDDSAVEIKDVVKRRKITKSEYQRNNDTYNTSDYLKSVNAEYNDITDTYFARKTVQSIVKIKKTNIKDVVSFLKVIRDVYKAIELNNEM